MNKSRYRKCIGGCFALVVSILLILPHTTYAEVFEYEDFSPMGFFSEQVSKLANDVARLSQTTAAFTAKIQRSRRNFFEALRNGQNIESARRAFEQRLYEKDLYYLLYIYVPAGVNTAHTKFFGTIGAVDGGINPVAKSVFEDWVRAIRFHLGARREDDMIVAAPDRLAKALAATADRALIYQRTRMRAELFASGVMPSRLFSPETYAKLLLEDHYSRYAMGNNPEYVRPDPAAIAAEWYGMLRRALGEEVVLNAAGTILQIPLDEAGHLREPFAFKSPPPEHVSRTANPFRAFNAILASTPKGYVIEQRGRRMDRWARGFAAGEAYYRDLVKRFGETRVLDVVKRVMNAPKTKNGKIIDPKSSEFLWPVQWIETLLENPNAELPSSGDELVISATDAEAVLRSIGKYREVYGRVSGIVWQKQSLGLDHFEILFEHGPGLRGFARRELETWQRRFGVHVRDLIGKMVRVVGFVQPGQANSGDSGATKAFVMISDPNDLLVIVPDDWPHGIPLPEGPIPKGEPTVLLAPATEFARERSSNAARYIRKNSAHNIETGKSNVSSTAMPVGREMLQPNRATGDPLQRGAVEAGAPGKSTAGGNKFPRAPIYPGGLDAAAPRTPPRQSNAALSAGKEQRAVRKVPRREITLTDRLKLQLRHSIIVADVIGKYRVLAELCSGRPKPEISDEYLAIVGENLPESLTEVRTLFEESYGVHRSRYARYSRCPEGQLKRAHKSYDMFMSKLR